jgi:hypothetical protein
MKNYYIQAQDTSGNWRTYHVTPAGPNMQRVLSEMKSLKQRYPDYRVRTIDDDGRVVDIL